MQLLSRLAFAKGIFLSSLPASASSSLVREDEDSRQVPMSESAHLDLSRTPHKQENQFVVTRDDYTDNPTVFGKILRGEINCTAFDEPSNVLTFQDIHPRADLHALVIPKRYIPTVFDLSPDDVDLLKEMKESALRVLRDHQPEAYRSGDYRLVFHVPPYNSVNHLHLHVLAPASRMGWFFKWIKYNPRTRWCTDWSTVSQRLQAGQPAVPYRRPASLQKALGTAPSPSAMTGSIASTVCDDDTDS